MRREGKNKFSWTTQEVVDTLMKQARKKYKKLPEDAKVKLSVRSDEDERVILELLPTKE